MRTETLISSLVQYGIDRELVEESDRIFVTNRLLETLNIHTYEPADPVDLPLEDILKGLLDDAVQRGFCEDDVISRDLLDTGIMGILTPFPHEVRNKFAALYAQSLKQKRKLGWVTSRSIEFASRMVFSETFTLFTKCFVDMDPHIDAIYGPRFVMKDMKVSDT